MSRCRFPVTKDIFRRGTNHDGRKKGGSSAPFQIILRHGRILIGTARSLTLGGGDEIMCNDNQQLLAVAANVFALSPEERQHCHYSNMKVVNRIKRSLAGIMLDGCAKRQRLLVPVENSLPPPVGSEALDNDDGDDSSSVACVLDGTSDEESSNDCENWEVCRELFASPTPNTSLATFLDSDNVFETTV